MKVIDKLLDLLLFMVVLPVLAIGVYAIIDARLVSKSATLDTKIQEIAARDDGEVLKELENDSEYVVAWLRISDTNINYPVVQGDDNSWFLNRNYKGEFATAGSLFLDYRNNNEFENYFSIIYGHRMGNGEMFSDIHKFKDANFFNSHLSGILKTRNDNWDLKVVAYAEVSARD